MIQNPHNNFKKCEIKNNFDALKLHLLKIGIFTSLKNLLLILHDEEFNIDFVIERGKNCMIV